MFKSLSKLRHFSTGAFGSTPFEAKAQFASIQEQINIAIKNSTKISTKIQDNTKIDKLLKQFNDLPTIDKAYYLQMHRQYVVFILTVMKYDVYKRMHNETKIPLSSHKPSEGAKTVKDKLIGAPSKN